ncbi:MAG: hypothetical protein GXX96_17230 [Planctomycetaceae bacterium]|nr:hypothetical protein [Planctomycetaceae bacterium]
MLRVCVLGLLGVLAVPAVAVESKLSLLIVDGMNNHDWRLLRDGPAADVAGGEAKVVGHRLD